MGGDAICVGPNRAILVSINPAYRKAELDYALNKTGVSVLMLAEAFKSSDYLKMINDLAPELHHHDEGPLELKALPQLKHIIRMGLEETAGC